MRRALRRAPLLPALLLATACGGAPADIDPHHHEAEEADHEYDRLAQRIEARIAREDSALGGPGDGEPMVGLSLVNLATGRRFGVNEDVSMHAASTMKVPVLFEMFRQAETGALSLNDSIVVENRFRSIQDGSPYSLSPEDDSDSTLYALEGQRVALRRLADLMIAHSSNLATNILIDVVRPERVRRTMTRLNAQGMVVRRGVEDIPAYRAGLNNTTTAYAFSRVLGAIARCELLSEQSCDEMTRILEGQEFRAGIPAGLPAGTRVANKTGWITGINHDGAIVYPPGQPPYVLVVLTRGIEGEARANRLIADLSRIVWQEVALQEVTSS